MTDSSQLPLWRFPLPDRYPSDLEGQLLLRGGAKIKLQKCADRFTVKLIRPVENLTAWVQQLGCEIDRELPSLGQIALRVEAAQLESVMAQLRRFPLRETAKQLPEVAYASHAYYLANTYLPDPDLPDPLPYSSENPSGLNSFEPSPVQPILYVTDQITLQFQPQTTAQQMEEITRAAGLEVMKLVSGIPKAFVYRLTDKAIVNPLKLANRMMQHPDLLLAEPNVAISTFSKSIDLQAGNEPLAFNIKLNPIKSDRAIVVAVVDRAIDLAHPAFAGVGKIVAPLDLSGSAAEGTEHEGSGKTKASQASGTLCAQLAIGEAFPSAETALLDKGGIAQGCSLMPITIDPLLDDSAIEQVFEWGVEQGAAVFCWSLTEIGGLPPSLRQRAAVYRAATQGRRGKGCVVLVKGSSGWDALPDSIPVAIRPFENGEAVNADPANLDVIELGIETGIAAQALTVNPNLTVEQVAEILQGVHARIGYPAMSAGSDVPAAVNLAIRLAMRYASQSSAVNPTSKMALQQLQFGDDRLPQEIPDRDEQGVVGAIAVEESAIIGDVEVRIAIDHLFMSDLKIWLISPRNEAILLQDRTFGSLPSLNMSYGLKTTPHLRSLLGQSSQGVWKLQVCDLASGHRGVLKEWQLRLGVQQPHQMS